MTCIAGQYQIYAIKERLLAMTPAQIAPVPLSFGRCLREGFPAISLTRKQKSIDCLVLASMQG